jgi:hypothetical protein
MAETSPRGATFDLSGGTFNGPVFNNSVFNEAVTITQSLGAPPAQQDEIAAALETLRETLAGLPDAQRSLANAAAESVKKVVEAAQGTGDETAFRGYARTLRGWAEDIAQSAPAVATAAAAVIKLVGQLRGWI